MTTTVVRLACYATTMLVAVGVCRADTPVVFNHDVRPILSDKCFACHGPDSNKREAGLRLDIRELALKELDSGNRAIVPGKPDESELLRRVTTHDADEAMPPDVSKLGRLTSTEIDTLRHWIAAGAKYQAHWALLPVEPVEVPPGVTSLPVGVKPHNAVDQIIFAGLAARKLAPQPEADRATVIRRVSFDLIGLPPTPAEVEAFVADRDPRAYERLIDRLLASPRYGERMAADWLDVARYADSYGFQVDRERETWPYRDWVIRAFNDNLSWDKFVTWQLAGDLLPQASDDQILATAFNRLHQQESEGGSVEEEYRVNYINDRVVTFGTAFLGLTLECCRCHDHKFDPITQKEFYQFFSFFDDIDEAGLYSFFTSTAPTPSMWLLDANQKTQLADAALAVQAAEETLASVHSTRREAFVQWLAHRPSGSTSLAGEVARFSFDERDKAGKFVSLVGTDVTAKSPMENVLVEGHSGQAIKLTGDHPVTTTVGNFHRYEPFSVSLWMKTPDVKDRAVVFHRSKAWTDAASRGYELLLEDGKLKWSLIHFWPGDAISIRAIEPAPVNTWIHVTVTSDGSSQASGLQLFVNGQPAQTEIIRDRLTKDITGGGGDTITIGERFRDRGFKNGLVDDFRVFDRQLSKLGVRDAFQPGQLATALTTNAGTLTAADRQSLFDFYLTGYDEAYRKQLDSLRSAREYQNKLADASREIMVMRELEKPKTAYILKRGEYQLRGADVEPNTPASLPPFPAGEPKNRLGLAHWLTDARHPLLSRVTVNRFWQACFGRGLVKTAEDFGTQSEEPEYPELIDWLSGELIRSGWDVKQLLKTIVLSHTYRQRSFSNPQQMAADPENLWLARGPRYRLPAEMIRDNMLSACGLLVDRIGGPPVRTYDMPESFKPSPAGKGEQLYRRSLYTFWRRTGPAPVLESFDVPKRVVCIARRDTTNSPLHAFVLLNGPQFVEAARVLGERLHKDCAGNRDQLVAEAFVRLTSRHPDATEQAILVQMYDQQRDWYQHHPELAKKYQGVGETKPDASLPAADIAAATAVINALMNYDGCVVKR